MRSMNILARMAMAGLALLGLNVAAAAQGRVEKNVVYGMYSGSALLLDVHYPAQPNGLGIVFIAGSGWNSALGYGAAPLKESPQVEIYVPSLTHESYELVSGGTTGRLHNVFLHCPFSNLEEVLQKTNVISSLGARSPSTKAVSMWGALGHGVWAFIRMYVVKRGFRDGWAGFVIALSNFEGTFYRYAKRYETAQNYGLPPEEPTDVKP